MAKIIGSAFLPEPNDTRSSWLQHLRLCTTDDRRRRRQNMLSQCMPRLPVYNRTQESTHNVQSRADINKPTSSSTVNTHTRMCSNINKQRLQHETCAPHQQHNNETNRLSIVQILHLNQVQKTNKKTYQYY